MTVKISRLGLRIDGWADLVEGAGEKAENALNAVAETMEARGFPNIEVKMDKAAPNTTSSKRRQYVFVKLPNGASTSVYIGQYGSDLYASWDLYLRPILNRRTMLIILGIALLIVGPGFACCSLSSFAPLTTISQPSYSFFDTTPSYDFSGGLWVVPLLMGSLCFNSIMLIFVALIVAGVVAILGNIIKDNPLAFFFKEITAFDADDIGAMGLAIHKSVLIALDSIGISTKNLRVKELFKAGGRERLI